MRICINENLKCHMKPNSTKNRALEKRIINTFSVLLLKQPYTTTNVLHRDDNILMNILEKFPNAAMQTHM